MESKKTAPNQGEIDWKALFIKILQHKYYVLIVTAAFTALGCFVALTSSRIYTVSVTLAPEVSGNSRAGTSLKGLTSLLGVGNLSLNTSNDALNITLFPEICKSTAFLSDLFDVKVNPFVSPKQLKKGVKPIEPLSLYDFVLGKHKPKSTFASLKESLFGTTNEQDAEDELPTSASYFNKEQMRVINTLRKCIGAEVDNKTGVTKLTVVMNDPKVAQEIADTVCLRLQEIITNYRIKKAEQDHSLYQKLAKEAELKMIEAQQKYAESVDNNRSVIWQSVTSERQRLQQEAMMAQELYSQMTAQENLAKTKIQEMRPVFAIIQPAVQPLIPSNSRKKIVLVYMFIGFCLSTGWKLFGREKLQELKAIWTESKQK
ncbi:MAG: hypothetical protein J6R79_01865 [Bacteroidaceae bacterium]|nr:hypothetical protein [Bacteroidaceae bacterium]